MSLWNAILFRKSTYHLSKIIVLWKQKKKKKSFVTPVYLCIFHFNQKDFFPVWQKCSLAEWFFFFFFYFPFFLKILLNSTVLSSYSFFINKTSFIQDEMIQLFWLCGLLGEIKYCSQKCSCSSGAGGDWCGVGEWCGLFCSYTQEADQGTCDLSSPRLFSDSPFKMVILFHLCDCKDLRLKKVLVFKTEDLIEYRPDYKLEWFWLMLRNNKCIIISLKNI